MGLVWNVLDLGHRGGASAQLWALLEHCGGGLRGRHPCPVVSLYVGPGVTVVPDEWWQVDAQAGTGFTPKAGEGLSAPLIHCSSNLLNPSGT